MTKKLKKPVSILLSLIMVFSLFTIVPLSASAAVGDVLSESEYLTFTAETAGSTVTLNVVSGSNLKYSLNGADLTDYSPGTPITLQNAGDSVRFSGTGTTFNSGNHVSLTGAVACSGNVMSLRLDDDGKVQGLAAYCFDSMFYKCTSLTQAPELPETELKNYCYINMFYNCTSLTKAPELPATNLAESCYRNMFSGCTSLTKAPELPATNLANSCYSNMFYNCTSLTKAPELPATELVDSCYYRMFYGCTSLTKAPELPATNLANSCYSYMFSGCKSLTKAPELPATNLAESCYNNMFYGCESLTELPALPATTLANRCYYYMFSRCSSLTELPALPATTLTPYCYYGMFYNCSNIRISTTQDTTYSVPYRIPTTGTGTTESNALYNMFRNTGGQFTAGTPDINTTYYLPAPAPATFKVYVKKLTNETYTIENLTGETTVAQLKEIIAAQIDIPATAQKLIFAGKTLEDAKTLAEYNIVEESTIHLVIRGYTVTWLNYDNSELDTTTVQYGSTPSYDGTPERPEDDDNTYTFSGWKNGETTYAPDALPAVSGEVTYTAVYTAEPKIPAPQLPDVIAGCTYYDSYWGVYANVPFAVNFSDIKDGAIIFDNYSDTCIMDTKDYSYKFYDQTGTELEAVLTESYDSDGYGYRVIMNVFRFSNPVSGPLYIVATAPAPTYTITWKNYDDSDIGTSTVAEGETPTFSDTIGEIKEKPDNALYTYTFSGWTPDVVAATADATYTATFTATEKSKKLIAGHSLSLDGNIGINFYLDPSVAGLTAQQVTADKLSYTFAWADVETTKAKVNVAEQANQKNFSIETINGVDYIKVTCYVCAAEMTCGVNATFTLNGKTESESEPYTVRKYCDDSVLSENAQYKDDTKLVELVKAMLNYGAMAQTKFKVNTGYLANQNVTYEKGDVTGTMIDTAIAAANGNKTADDMNAVAAALGAKWFSTSLIYLDDSTLRHYFVKDTDAFNSSAYTGNKSNYYYYVEVSGIAAAELDNLQSFTAGTESFKYSALDFVKGMITSSADEDSKNLAKSLYWYNQEANEYFPAPAEKILVLDDVNEDTTVEDGYTITGTLQGDYKISIADGATVTLRDVDITCLTNGAKYAGITLAGDATINLEGANTVKGGYEDYAGVYVPEGKTLTIDGTGSLDASSNGYGCGIGAGNNGKPAGNIVINGGTITAIGGDMSAGIGGSHKSNCGDITITGGTVYAESLGRAPGIGAGHGFYGSRCGNITISGGSVTAIGESYGSGIGTGLRGVCGAILITAGVTQVTATKGSNAPNSIGAGKNGTCGTVTIENGANVTQN